MAEDSLPISLRQLQYLVAVADHASISAAATALEVSQPSVTHQLQLLEETLGVPLVVRHPRGVRLTGAGEVVVARARRLLLEVAQLKEGLDGVAEARGKVRIGIVPTASSHQFPALYRGLGSRYPGIQVELFEESSLELVDGVRHGDLEMAVVALPLRYADIRLESLWREELVVITAPDHPLGKERAVHPSRLAEVPFVSMAPGNGLQSRVLELFHEAGTQPRIVFTARSVATIAGFVAAGVGVSIVPIEGVRHYAALGVVRMVPLSPPAFRHLVLVHRPLEELSPAAGLVVRYILGESRRIHPAELST
ncbi:MAG: LysR family transcriptional regulator [Firmicutes bacterium]|nr:LysR family transcriptional regulator [Bacillota bacterium]